MPRNSILDGYVKEPVFAADNDISPRTNKHRFRPSRPTTRVLYPLS